MRLYPFDITVQRATAPAASIFGGAPVPFARTEDVSKVADGAVVNPHGTAMVQAADQRSRTGTGVPAMGIRPDPGALPAETEQPFDPARFQAPYGANLQLTPRTGFGTPFSTLRNLASASPEIFMCVQARKDQIAALHLDFAPRDKRATAGALEQKIAYARAFFARPDGVTPWATWAQQLVDEVLVIDALSIFKRRVRAAGRGRVPGSDIYGYELIDGSTIKPLLDQRAMVPPPPAKAYRQVLLGVPSTDWTADELLYRPKNARTWSPYGMSPTEALFLVVTGALNRQLFNLSYYAEGNIPEALVGVPDTWQPKQIQQFNDYWNLLLKGDPKNRSGLRFVTKTMAESVHEFKSADFSTDWELWLLKVICACFGVTPSEVGFTDDVNRATAKSQGETSQRRGAKPMMLFIKGIIDELLATDLGLSELEVTFTGGEGEGALEQAKVDEIHIKTGIKSLDEIRARNGDPVIGVGPAVVTATGPVFWERARATDPTGADDDFNPAHTPDDVDAQRTQATADAQASARDDAAQLAEDAELKKYQTVALKAVKAGRVVPTFTSSILPAALKTTLAADLATAATPTDVKAVFARVQKAQELTRRQQKQQDAMAGRLAAVLAAQGAALAAHLDDGITAAAAEAEA